MISGENAVEAVGHGQPHEARRRFFQWAPYFHRANVGWHSVADPVAQARAVHFDLKFDDRPAAEALALSLGAIPLPALGGSCPVYADPAGHPMCFCYPGE